MEDAVAKVEFGSTAASRTDNPAKARKGIRAVPKNCYVRVTFTADDGEVFQETGTNTYTKDIEAISGNVVFSANSSEYKLPTVM